MEYTNSRVREIIADYVHSQRDREIMCRRLIDGITLEKLAEEFDLSVSQVKRIIKAQETIIFRHVGNN